MSLLTLVQKKMFTYTEKEREGSSSFLPHSPKRLGELGAQNQTQSTAYGTGRGAERCGDRTLARSEIAMQVPAQG